MKKKTIFKQPLFWSTVVLGVTTIVFAFATYALAERVNDMNSALAKYNMCYDSKDKDIYIDSSSSSDSENSSSSSSTEESSTTTSSSETVQFYKTGTGISFTNGLMVKVNSITEDTSRTLNDGSGNIPVVVNFTIENRGSSSWRMNPQYFSMVDGSKNIANFDSSSYETNFPNSLTAGQSITADIIFSAKNNGPYQVTFSDTTWSNEYD